MSQPLKSSSPPPAYVFLHAVSVSASLSSWHLIIFLAVLCLFFLISLLSHLQSFNTNWMNWTIFTTILFCADFVKDQNQFSTTPDQIFLAVKRSARKSPRRARVYARTQERP